MKDVRFSIAFLALSVILFTTLLAVGAYYHLFWGFMELASVSWNLLPV